MRKLNVILVVDDEVTLKPGSYICETQVLDVSEHPPILGAEVKISRKVPNVQPSR